MFYYEDKFMILQFCTFTQTLIKLVHCQNNIIREIENNNIKRLDPSTST